MLFVTCSVHDVVGKVLVMKGLFSNPRMLVGQFFFSFCKVQSLESRSVMECMEAWSFEGEVVVHEAVRSCRCMTDFNCIYLPCLERKTHDTNEGMA